MKKFMAIIVIIVMMVISAVSVAEAPCYGDYRDNVWSPLNFKVDVYNKAFAEGEEVYPHTYLYEGILYFTDTYLSATYAGYEGDLESYWHISDYLEEAFHEDGVKHATVHITQIGKNGDEPIYDIEIMTIYNLNEVSGEHIGNGFIKEGLEYYGMRVLGPIH